MRDGVSYDELDAQHTADALLVEHATLVAAEARKALRIGHWADLHDPASITHPVDGSGPVLPGTERPKTYGGHGTPQVAEFAVSELAALLGLSEVSAGNLLTDVLDLRHRHPRLWDLVTSTAFADAPGRDPAAATGLPRLWHLRQIVHATHTAGLTLAQARWVDAATTPWLRTLPWARFEDLLKAKVIEADPAAARAREQAAATRRYVATGQTNEHGLKTLIAQAGAGDVIVFVAMLDRIAQCLRRDGDTDTLEVRRSTALGIIANPAAALDLLLRHATTPSDNAEPAESAQTDHNGDAAVGEPAESAQTDPDSCDAADGEPADAAGEPAESAQTDTGSDSAAAGGPAESAQTDIDGDHHGDALDHPDHAAPGDDPDGEPAESAQKDADGHADDEPQAPVPGTELDLFDQRRIHPGEPTQTICLGHRDGSHCGYCVTPGTGPRPRGHRRPGFFGHRATDDDQQALDTYDAHQAGSHGSAGGPGGPPGTGPDPHSSPPRPGPTLPGPPPDDTGPPDLTDLEAPDPALLRPGDLHPRHHDSDDSDGHDGAAPCSGCGCPGHPAPAPAPGSGSAGRVDPAKLRPQAVVYVHVDQASFTRDAQGVARFENGIGPVTLQTAREILRHHHVTVRAVIDLPRQRPVDCYEAPARLREAVKLTYPHSVFPYAPTSSRAGTIDLDHPVPYRHPIPGQPRKEEDQGQTSLDNLAPLGRRSHRVKTHARGWIHRHPTPGTHLWRTPHGYTYRVDADGTHALGRKTAREFQQLCDDLASAPVEESPGQRHFLRLIDQHQAG